MGCRRYLWFKKLAVNWKQGSIAFKWHCHGNRKYTKTGVVHLKQITHFRVKSVAGGRSKVCFMFWDPSLFTRALSHTHRGEESLTLCLFSPRAASNWAKRTVSPPFLFLALIFSSRVHSSSWPDSWGAAGTIESLTWGSRMLAAAPLNWMSVAAPWTWRTASRPVVVVHAEPGLDHYIAVEVLVATVFIWKRRRES